MDVLRFLKHVTHSSFYLISFLIKYMLDRVQLSMIWKYTFSITILINIPKHKGPLIFNSSFFQTYIKNYMQTYTRCVLFNEHLFLIHYRYIILTCCDYIQCVLIFPFLRIKLEFIILLRTNKVLPYKHLF